MKLLQDNLLPRDGEVYLLKNYYQKLSLEDLIQNMSFRADKIKMFGKTFDQARKVAWYGDEGVSYKYSNISMQAVGWTAELEKMKDQFIKDFSVKFNSVLVNLYRNGEDHMSYHQDNEKELGDKPCIFSVSLGVGRDFYLKHIETGQRVGVFLEHGDLLIMKGHTQEFWKHSLPKRKKIKDQRLNLTFRTIY